MLKSSRCSVTFPINGMSLSGEITFQPGITAVVGRNGTGKTFRTIELWRYLLFGKKALRGPASDYKNLVAEGVVRIKGVDYQIKRSAREETIAPVGEETIAVGADEVNKKVVELLGFGLDVFDITNASVQKQSNKLTQLTPAKRKELIDEVCGLALNEKAEKDCKEKAKLLKLEADTIRDNMSPLTEPVKPDSYRLSADLQKELTIARATELERAHLLREISTGIAFDYLQEKPELPRQDVASIDAHEASRLVADTERAKLQAVIDTIPVSTYTAQEVKDAQAWVQYDAELARRGPKPELDEETADDALNLYNHIEALKRVSVQVQCPECDHKFTPARELPDSPEKERAYYEEQKRRLTRWETPPVTPTGKRIEHSLLQEAHTAVARGKERYDLIFQLSQVPKLSDRSAELATARDVNMMWDRYEDQQAMLEKDAQRVADAEKALKDLPPVVDIAALDAAFVAARVYEMQLDRYDADKADFLAKQVKIRDKQTEAEDFTQGAKRLVEARREVKGYLAPSLSRIASALIAEMTCGKLSQVVVDEDMNVSVNGQDVATLSGAGETAANLALRLALGRTLVGGVFPVFLGDEIDADADEERSEATFECLRNLKGQFGQVIIITHKPHVLADHVIDFDDDQ